MKGVKLQLALPAGSTTSSDKPALFSYRSGTETLQINSILLRGVVKPQQQQHAKKEDGKAAYLPHWKLRQSRRRVVTLRAHVEGPEGGAEMVVPVAVVNLAPWQQQQAAAPSGDASTSQLQQTKASETAAVVSAVVKVDLRFQMETVKFSLQMKETGDFREDAGLNVEAVLMGTVSPIQ